MLFVDGKQVLTTLDEIADPIHTVILLIDFQNDFIMPNGYADKMGWDLHRVREILPNVKHLLAVARDAGVPVAYAQLTLFPNHVAESPAVLHSYLLRTGHKAGDQAGRLMDRCVKGTWGWKIIDELAPLPGDLLIEKQHSSAFMDTNLNLLLRSNGIRSVVVTGLVTEGCVMATADDMPVFGYYPILVQDCITNRRPELHQAAFLIMSQRMLVVNSAEVISVWAGGSSRHPANHDRA